jgi:uncharacterized protein (TIGR02145 family)
MRIKSICILLFAGTNAYAQTNTYTDSRDNKTYRVMSVNGKTWLAENLRFHFDEVTPYGKQPENEKLGYLYTLEEASKACPKNWHLPTKGEWNGLTKTLPGKWNDRGGIALPKQVATSHDIGIQLNGFRLPEGRDVALGRMTVFWTASDSTLMLTGDSKPELKFIGYHVYSSTPDSLNIEPTFSKSPEYGYYCRCVKD